MTNNTLQYIIIDSSVLLHDPLAITRYPELVVVIAAGCLYRLQTVGRETSELARNARDAARLIESAVDSLANGETDTKPGQVFIDVDARRQTNEFIESDDGTLGLAQKINERHGNASTLLLSRDAAVRALCKAMHVRCEPYELRRQHDASDDNGLLVLNEVPKELTESRATDELQIAKSRFPDNQPAAVGKLVIDAHSEQALGVVISDDGDQVTIRGLQGPPAEQSLWGIRALNVQQAGVLAALCDPDIDLVSIQGDAGTGKTLLAIAAGLHLVFDKELYSEVLITRATISVGDEIGFLPGTEEEKMHPWMGAIEDSLELLLPSASDQAGRFGKSSSQDLIRRRIKVRSMSFMRGRTFTQKFVIIDEAQNLTAHEMRMMITRAGNGTKVVCLGNMQQIDTPWLSQETSGLTWLDQHFLGWPHCVRIVLEQVERSRLADRAGATPGH